MPIFGFVCCNPCKMYLLSCKITCATFGQEVIERLAKSLGYNRVSQSKRKHFFERGKDVFVAFNPHWRVWFP